MQTFSGRLDMAVLICSSSRQFRQSLETILDAMGCVAAASVGDAGEACQQSNAQHFDVAIVDEDFDALEIVNLPTVRMVSGRDADAGNCVLPKPFRPADLARILTDSLAGRPAQHVTAAHVATS